MSYNSAPIMDETSQVSQLDHVKETETQEDLPDTQESVCNFGIFTFEEYTEDYSDPCPCRGMRGMYLWVILDQRQAFSSLRDLFV